VYIPTLRSDKEGWYLVHLFTNTSSNVYIYTHTGEYNCINLYVGGCPHTDRTYTSPQLPGGCAISMRSVAYKSGKKDKLEEYPPSH